MTEEQIRAVLERVLAWSAEAQAEAVASLEMIEEEFSHHLSEDDRRALERSGDDVRLGRIVSEEKAKAVFSRFRNA